MRRAISITAFVAAAASVAFGGYNWYYGDSLTASSGNWYQNGSVSFTSAGLTS